MKQIAEIIKEHPFFEGLTEDDLTFIAGCGKNVIFQENETIARAADPADEFYLICEGQAAISLEVPPRKAQIFQTMGPNEILGLSWLIPPYRWTVSAHAVQRTRAVAINGACLREKCEKDPRLGFKLMKHLVAVLVKREEAALLHLLDVYGGA